MTVCRKISALVALSALALSVGCGGGDSLAYAVETDDPLYQQSLQQKRLGRTSEALASLLKVIEKRGELPSPEAHLDAGLIYLDHIKDPIEAIHHFKKYLDLAPNSTKAPLVRQRIDGARRELFRSMPGRPSDELAGRSGGPEMIERLQRENDELRAELGRQRGVAGALPLRTTRGPVDVPELLPPLPVQSAGMTGGGQIRLAPPPPGAMGTGVAQPMGAGGAVGATGLAGTAQNFGGRTTGAPASTQSSMTRGVTTPTRPMAPGTTVAGRRHTVAAGETLYRIGLKYGGVKPEAIAAVNREVLTAGVNSKLSPGMELKIP